MNRRLLCLLAPAALALATFAQAQPPGPGVERQVRIIRAGPGGEGDLKAMHEAMMKQHVEDLKTVLRLRPDQEPALQAFLAAQHAGMGGPPMMMRHGGPGGDGPPMPPKPMTTPERLDQMARHQAAMTEQQTKAREALAKFYAALSPDQQKVFDALQRLRGPGGHGGGMMGPGMRRIEIRRGPGGPGGEHEGHGPD